MLKMKIILICIALAMFFLKTEAGCEVNLGNWEKNCRSVSNCRWVGNKCVSRERAMPVLFRPSYNQLEQEDGIKEMNS